MICLLFTFVSLHAFLIVVYLALLVVHILKLEERVVVPLGSDKPRHFITDGSQIFIVLFSVSLLLLARKRLFNSSLHNAILTCPGGRTTFNTVCRQLSRVFGRAPGFGILMTYLCCLSILLATTPSLFGFVASYHVNIEHATTTTRSLPPGGFPGPEFGYPDLIDPYTFKNWNNNRWTMWGYPHSAGNIVYGDVYVNFRFETPSIALPTYGNVTVNGTVFDVKCFKLPSATSKRLGNDTWFISTPIANVTMGLTDPAIVRVAALPWSDDIDYSTTPYSVLLYAPFPIKDLQGRVGSSVNLEYVTDAGESRHKKVTVAGCTLYTKSVTVDVDPFSGRFLSLNLANDSAEYTPATWQEWTLPDYMPDPYTAAWGGIWNFDSSIKSDEYEHRCPLGDMNVVERKLNEEFRRFPSGYRRGTLYELEESLSDLTAFAFNQKMRYESTSPGTVEISQVMYKLQLNNALLIIDLFLSVVLFLLAVPMLDTLSMGGFGLPRTVSPEQDRFAVIAEPYSGDVKNAVDVPMMKEDGGAGCENGPAP